MPKRLQTFLRWALNALTVLSAVLFLAVVALWVRSYYRGDGFVWKSSAAPAYYRLYVGSGGVRVGSGAYSFDRAPYLDYYPDDTPTRQTGFHPGTLPDRLGFDYHRGSDSPGQPSADALFPLWAAALAAAALPAGRLAFGGSAARCRRRLAAGLCPACAYDLTANQSGVCPECGRPIQPVKR